MKHTENYGYQIKSYRFVGEDKFEVYLKGVKIPGVFDTYCQAEQYCQAEIINDAADKYVFDEADHNRKWSNNDDTAGDNFGSFKAGANWAISQMQLEWVSVEDRLPDYDVKVLVRGEQMGMNPQMGGAYNCISQRIKLPKQMVINSSRYVDENDFKSMQYVTHWMPLPQPPTK
jgi:hypothetical protein